MSTPTQGWMYPWALSVQEYSCRLQASAAIGGWGSQTRPYFSRSIRESS
jgi:hypothetical protein